MLFKFIEILADKSLLKFVNHCVVEFNEYQQTLYECAKALTKYEDDLQNYDMNG